MKKLKCSIKFFSLFVLSLFMCVYVFATNYYWDEANHTQGNWQGNYWVDSSGQPLPNYPGPNDIAIFKGTVPIEVTADTNITVKEIWVNANIDNPSDIDAQKITIKVNGGSTLTTENFVIHNTKAQTASVNCNIEITGDGNIVTQGFDFPSTGIHIIQIDNNTSFSITDSTKYFVSSNGSMTFTGNGTLNEPAGGGTTTSGIASGIQYTGNIKPYSVTETGRTGFPTTPITITLDCGSATSQEISFPYTLTTIKTTGTGAFKLDTYQLATGSSSQGPGGDVLKILSGSSTATVNITYDDSNGSAPIQTGDGFTIEIKSPADNTTVLYTITYSYTTPAPFGWTGAVSSAWDNVNNWNGLDPSADFTTNYNNLIKGKDITISASCVNMPVISLGSYELNSLTINNGASFTIAKGSANLELGELNVEGTFENGGTSVVTTSAGISTGAVTIKDGATFTNNGAFTAETFSFESSATSGNLTLGTNQNDTFTINSNGLTIPNGITTNAAGNLTFTSSSLTLNNNINVLDDLIVNDTITLANAVDFVTTSGAHNVTFLCNVNCGNNNFSTSNNILVTVGAPYTIDSSNGADVTFGGAVINNGKITGGAGGLTFGGNYSGSGSLTLSSTKTTINADFDLSAVTTPSNVVANGGEVEFASIANMQTYTATQDIQFYKITVASNDITLNTPYMTSEENQTYKGNVTIAQDIAFSASNSGGASATPKDITFNANLSCNSTMHNIDFVLANVIVSTNVFECGKLTVSSNSNFTQTGDNATSTQSVGGIVADGTVVWDSAENGGSLILTGDITGINASDVLFNKKNVTIANNLTISGVFYDLTIDNGFIATNGSSIGVRRNFTINGSYADAGNVLTLGKIIVGTGASSKTYNSEDGIISGNAVTAQLGEVDVTQGGTTKTFDIPFSATTIHLNDTTASAGKISFNKNFTIDELENNTGTNFDISLNDGGTQDNGTAQNSSVTNKVTMNTTGNISIGRALDTIAFTGGLEIPLGGSSAVNLGGKITSATTIEIAKDILLSDDLIIVTPASSLGGAQSSTAIFNGDITGQAGKSFTIGDATTASSCSFTKASGATVKTITGTGNTGGAQTYFGPVTTSGNLTISNGGFFLTHKDADFNITGNFLQNGNGKNQIAGGISATGTVDFAQDVYLYKDGALDTKMTLSTWSAPTINVFVGTNDKTVEIANQFKAKNFILMSGIIAFATGGSATLETTQDMILFGANYKEDDTDSGVNELFKYDCSFRTGAPCSYTNGLPTTFPNGDTIPLNKGKFDSTLSGQSLTVGKNFYANGIDLQSTSDWNLSFDLTNGTINDTNGEPVPKEFFAEMYNLNVSHCVSNAWVSAGENCTNGGNNQKIDTAQPKLLVDDGTLSLNTVGSGSYTMYDDIIRIEVVADIPGGGNSPTPMPLFNSGYFDSTGGVAAGATIQDVTDNITLNDGALPIGGIYNDIDCTTAVNWQGSQNIFYVKSNSRWNTDATGMSAGDANSTDTGRAGIEPSHNTIKPNLTIPKARGGSSTPIYALLVNEHKNRLKHYGDTSATSKTFTAITDRCAPALIAVKIGQETHELNKPTPPHYDAHNFIELQYSEPVDVGDLDSNTSAKTLNIEPNTTFANATEHGGIITNNANGFTIQGFVEIANGNISTGSRDKNDNLTQTDMSVNVLYRKNLCHIRISIAGQIDGTVTVSNRNVNFWHGFINPATQQPSGAVTRIQNQFIKDKAGNILRVDEVSPSNSHGLNSITLDDTQNGDYGAWDLTPPSVARYTKWKENEWDKAALTNQFYEVLPVDDIQNPTGYINAFEIHIFDNAPKYDSTDDYRWSTREYWYNKNDVGTPPNIPPTTKKADVPLDFFGGARSFVTSAERTHGGIRAGSLYNAVQRFSIRNNSASNQLVSLNGNVYQKTTDQNFFGTSGVDYDVPYLGLKVTASTDNLITHEYSVKYADGFITDLAGNRLANFDWIDTPGKTKPDFSLAIAPLGSSNIFILFTKKIRANSPQDLDGIVESLKLMSGATNLIDKTQGSVATKTVDTQYGTGVTISLANNHKLTYDEIKNLKYEVNQLTGPDPVTGQTRTDISHIYDVDGNYVTPRTLSDGYRVTDFAINVVDVLYAYDGRNGGDVLLNPVSADTAWCVRDFSGSGSNNSKIYPELDIVLVSRLAKENNASISSLEASQIEMHIDISPTPNSNGGTFTKLSGVPTRLWICDDFEPYAPTPNISTSQKTISPEVATSPDDGVRKYFIPNKKDTPNSFNWPRKSDVQFTFKIDDLGLYAARLKDQNDLSSIDLWSFEISNPIKQRGGVSILNNVINVNTGEQCTVDIEMPSDGNLIVIVTTLEGSVVKYLQHGRVAKGSHQYQWNGTNNKGNAVARGLYFVRVIADGIDETRKVMCTK